RSGLAVITIDNPPVNALSQPVRAGLIAALEAALADAGTTAILIVASGRTWPVGADLREFQAEGRREPLLSAVNDLVARAAKPVVVLMKGTALGGGLELALAAGVRLAEPGTRLGLPEVTLGLCPGAGGTRRLPALIGAGPAIEMMLGGTSVTAERALDLGLVDRIVTGGQEEAEALARGFGEGAPTPARLQEGNAVYLGSVAQARAAQEGSPGARLPAPGRILDCVEGAVLLPERAAAEMERVAFEDLLATQQSRALRHMFRAERLAGHHPRTEGVLAAAPSRIAVAGGGAAGADLAGAFLGAWMNVTFGAEDADALAAGLARIAAAGELAVEAGRMTPAAREAEWKRLTGGIGLAGFATAEVGVLVGPRAAEAAHAAAQALPEGAVLVLADVPGELASFAAASGRGQDVVGLTLVSPPGAPRMAAGALAEILAPPGASAGAVAAAVALARSVRAQPVVARTGLVAAISAAVQRAADALIEAGAGPYSIDRVLGDWGLAEGPFAMRDRHNLADRPASDAAGPVSRALAEALEGRGRPGIAAGAGFYLQDVETGALRQDAEIAAMLSSARAVAGRPFRPGRVLSPEVIAGLFLAVVANEGARLVSGQAVARPSDVDVAAVLGSGFPRWQGGPMQAADEAGLLRLRNLLRRFAEEMRMPGLVPDPLWDDLIREGRRFADLNGG
ncbi:MAG: hypothetical protein RLZZ528_1217, partial [Pseudomonadota bacterium]